MTTKKPLPGSHPVLRLQPQGMTASLHPQSLHQDRSRQTGRTSSQEIRTSRYRLQGRPQTESLEATMETDLPCALIQDQAMHQESRMPDQAISLGDMQSLFISVRIIDLNIQGYTLAKDISCTGTALLTTGRQAAIITDTESECFHPML